MFISNIIFKLLTIIYKSGIIYKATIAPTAEPTLSLN